MSNPTPMNDEQARCLQVIAGLEHEHGRPVTLAETAEAMQMDHTRAREVISGLLSDGPDLVREVDAPEPDETAYTVKTKP